MRFKFARMTIALGLVAGLAACQTTTSSRPPPPPKGATGAPIRANQPFQNQPAGLSAEAAKLLVPDCYTVDPYQPVRITKASRDLPKEQAAYLGRWGGGAWDGEICHDIWIMEVTTAGQVLMFDAHGPGFHPDATAFTRRGEITKDGRIRVRKGRAWVEYWIENGRLHGVRDVGGARNRIIMTRKS